MEKLRGMHFINQFFAGIGGEDKADTPVGQMQGPVGPGKRLQELLGDSVEIATTVYCGDNYFNNKREEALKKIVQIARDSKVDILIAGPAFDSGRYGFSCIEIAQAVSTALNIQCVIGLFPENPATAGYRQYKNRSLFVIPVAKDVSKMGEALEGMA